MRRRWMYFIAVLVSFVGTSQASVADAQTRAAILTVNRATASGSPHGVAQLRMPKFLEEESTVRGDVYRVIWQPVGGELPAGVQVRFAYTQQRTQGIKSLQIAYPFAVKERRTATFNIADRAYAQGGPVSSWRVRVTQDGHILAEQESPNWESPR